MSKRFQKVNKSLNREEVVTLLKENKEKYYVYALCWGKVPFYVGKGKNNRIFDHNYEIYKKHESYKVKKMKWAIKNDKLRYYIICFTKYENKALNREKILIKKYGFTWNDGQLYNLTTGGQSGCSFSPQVIEKRKQTYKDNPEIMQNLIKKRNKTLKDNPEILEIRAEHYSKSFKNDPTILQKLLKNRNKTLKDNPEIMQNQGKAIKKYWKN